MSERKFKITLTEDELKAVINYNRFDGDLTPERTGRIHELTKRLFKKDDEPVTTEVPNPPSIEGWN